MTPWHNVAFPDSYNYLAACDPCDANCDGQIDAFDIEPFIDCLVGP
jgi:hypothetical protein